MADEWGVISDSRLPTSEVRLRALIVYPSPSRYVYPSSPAT